MSLWLARFSLLAALVLSQALYAGHGVSHSYGDQVDCGICLQASSGSAALTSGEIQPLITVGPTVVERGSAVSAASKTFLNPYPPRAPPIYSF